MNENVLSLSSGLYSQLSLCRQSIKQTDKLYCCLTSHHITSRTEPNHTSPLTHTHGRTAHGQYTHTRSRSFFHILFLSLPTFGMTQSRLPAFANSSFRACDGRTARGTGRDGRDGDRQGAGVGRAAWQARAGSRAVQRSSISPAVPFVTQQFMFLRNSNRLAGQL